MALLHATPLWLGNVTSINPAKTALYTVPAAHRIILRSIAIRNLNGAASQSFFVYVDGVIVWTFLATSGGSSGGSGEWRPWVVLGPGQVLQGASQTGTGFGVAASGSIYTI